MTHIFFSSCYEYAIVMDFKNSHNICILYQIIKFEISKKTSTSLRNLSHKKVKSQSFIFCFGKKNKKRQTNSVNTVRFAHHHDFFLHWTNHTKRGSRKFINALRELWRTCLSINPSVVVVCVYVFLKKYILIAAALNYICTVQSHLMWVFFGHKPVTGSTTMSPKGREGDRKRNEKNRVKKQCAAKLIATREKLLW